MKVGYGSVFGRAAMCTFLVIFLMNLQQVEAQSLIPDQSFGQDGWVFSNTYGFDEMGYAFELLPDGKIIAAGSIQRDTNDDGAFDQFGIGLYKYNSDGSLDDTFGTNGFSYFTGFQVRDPRGMTVQSDGKILITGGAGDLMVMRVNASGTIDSSFGPDGTGVVALNVIDFRQPNRGNDIVIDGNGKIVVVGDASGFASAVVVRFNSNGIPDSTFNEGAAGINYPSASGTNWNGIALQPDGKIVIGGNFNDAGNRNASVVRLNADGTWDTSFGTNGRFVGDFGTSLETVEAVAIQDDGKIVFTGAAGPIPDRDILHGRLNTDGTLDNSYSGDGRSILSLTGNDVGSDLRILPDGKILIGGNGSASSVSNTDFVLYRVNSDGSNDNTFGDNSPVIFADLNNDADVVREMAIQDDGKILLFGDTEFGSTEYFATLRLQVPPPQNTFIVTNSSDSGAGSLREIMTTANNTINGGKPDRIIFDIPTSDPGYNAASGTWTISPTSGLPELTDPVIIDGLNGGQTPLIEINGTNATGTGGFTLSAGGSTIAGLIINNFSDGTGVSLDGPGQNDIRSNYIGTDETGELNEGNGSFGVFVNNSPLNRIRDNVISGNNVGVFIQNGSADNIVEDNYIGLNKGGDTAIPNVVEGIRLINLVENTLVQNNFISGNGTHGVAIYSSNNNFVWSNRIGTNSAGTSAIGNQADGVYIIDSGGNEIGGDTSDKRNIISGNISAGVSVRGTAIQNVIRNNFIGTNILGTADLGNGGGGGVSLSSSNGNVVQQNLISGNGGDPATAGPGVTVTQLSKNNSIRDNLIGYNASGTSGIGNANNGVLILGNNNLVRDNSIAANGRSGIEIAGGDLNTVCGNKIGVVFAENAVLHNDFFGIWLNSGAQGNYIGGGASGCGGNLVVDDQVAIYINGTESRNNEVYGNLIGKTAGGFEPGGQSGITIVDADSNKVGLLATGFGNTIASMSQSAISISANGGTAVGNSMKGNLMSNGGSLGIDLGANGITTNDAGDTDSGPNNYQNYPEIISMTYDSVNTEVEIIYSLDTDPANATYPINIDFYKDSGDRQAAGYLGTASLFENDFGETDTVRYNNVEFTSLQIADQIIGVATDSDGNSSEFSAPVGFTTDNGNGGGGDTNTFIVTNTNDSGAGSLRQAILDANANPNGALTDSVVFQIDASDPGYESGSGTWKILPATGLPEITDPVVITGAEQGESPKIEINGSNLSTADGLVINTGNSIIQGLIINNFGSGSGIVLSDGPPNTILNNYIGTDETGSAAEGNSQYGIWVLDGSSHLILYNVLSGNGISGLRIDSTSSGNLIEGNIIGLTAGKVQGPGNTMDGMHIWGDFNQVNTNWSAGNGGSGIKIQSGAGNLLCGNNVGLNADLDAPIPNGNYGIHLNDGASDNTIGDPVSGCAPNLISDDEEGIRMGGTFTSGNIIKGNLFGTNENGDNLGGGTGIFVRDATNNTIGSINAGNIIAYMSSKAILITDNSGQATGNNLRGNIMLANALIGLDLGGDNVTVNDTGDADEGPNRLQNYPVVSSVEYDSVNSQVTLNYELDTDPANAAYPVNVDFYLQGGDRQPVRYLGTDTIFENESGTVQLPAYNNAAFLDLEIDDLVIAMATDDEGNSSEFSDPVSVSRPTIVSNESDEGVPTDFVLKQNYPNPFNPTTVISFGIPVASEVQVNIFNLLGQRVSTLVDQRLNAGYHEFSFDASGLPSGIYLYRIQADGFTAIKKMMLVK
ncbi:right-handed parallel beta-helix repeat-containing protein [Balneola sp. MJW-20]|uniref:right-handed parallel beta-helix repeat-containing protein n=1 Tax=Gracilimonas aurantiaca TaxID=3234185 RepID=UPI0034671526